MNDHEEHSAEKRPEPTRANLRLRRLLGILSALVSLACLVVLVVIWTRVYTAPPVPQPADHVVTTPDEVSRYLKAYI
jgi:cell division septal protein FtsQ